MGRLLGAGCRVTVVDDFSTGDRKRLTARHASGRLRILDRDIRDPACLRETMALVDGVFHLAARVSVPDCIDDWIGNHGLNVTATLGLFDVVREVKRVPVVYASSAAVYGNQSDLMCHEEMAGRPISPYGADKLSCENHARAFWSIHGIPSAGLRFFNVYGPGQPTASPYAGVIWRFVQSISAGKAPEIHGDGGQSRDFVHVSNAVDALIAGMARLSDQPDALVCNVCTGISHSVRDIAYLLADILGAGPLRLAHLPARSGDIRHSRGDPRHLQRTLAPGPFLTLQEGLADWLAEAERVRRVS